MERWQLTWFRTQIIMEHGVDKEGLVDRLGNAQIEETQVIIYNF